MEFTVEQENAIHSLGKTIVSASAGSGKTTVMIEKIIRLIKDGGDVREILAVTFTKKAAAQMKEKLRKALEKAINEDGVSLDKKAQLKEQLDEVSNADISTIHSFCAKLIRTHFYEAKIDNNFRIMSSEDAEGVEMQNEALDELLDEGYKETDGKFTRLLSVYWRKKSDLAFRKIILSTYQTLRNRADYKQYLKTAQYTEETFDKICEDLHERLKEKCRYYARFLEKERVYFQENACEPQLKLIAELLEKTENILQSATYFDACAVEKSKFTVSRKSKKDSEEKLKHVERLAEIKKKIVKIFDDELEPTKSRAEELAAFLSAGEIAEILACQLEKFDEKYTALKRERGVLDYNDLEHEALALLNKSEVAEELHKQYQFVFVDEYQDVNPVQEQIISKISENNLFLVGDVKQSIYGFRGSKSKFFVEKQAEFSAGQGASLYLKSNYRSSDKVLKAVNNQFALAMTKENTSVDYQADAWMLAGGRYALNDGRVCLHVLSNDAKSEETETEKTVRGIYSVEESAKKKSVKDDSAAKRLKQIIESEILKKWYDADEGVYKDITYSDIVILSRKKQGKIAVNIAELAGMGVPVTSVAAVNVCDYAEVKTLIDVLSLIDNAEQDVPLCSALLSPIGDMDANELTDIRLEYKKEKFFRVACKRYAKEKTDKTAYKLRNFFEYFERIRKESCVLSVAELLTKIMRETRMETALLSKANGVACLKRIRRFIEESQIPEPTCVHEFLRRLRDMDYKVEFNENGGEDSVKVLTMHASKGLEFPVVILDDLNAPFKGVDREEVFVEEKYGLATRAFDEKNMLKRETLLRRLHVEKETQDSIQDELNLYYVALTRAKYALHLIAKDSDGLQDVRYARSFADFTDFSVWEEFKVIDDEPDMEKPERQALVFAPNEKLVKEIMQAFEWKYPFAGYENLPVKSSATALMSGQNYEEVFQKESLQESTGETSLDYTLFDGDEESYQKTDKEQGIVYHAFLETFDFSQLYKETGERISKEELQKAVDKTLGKMRKENAENVGLLKAEKLVEILQNPVFYELKNSELYKEQQFIVSLPVLETYGKRSDFENTQQGKNEEMIFQGAIDLLAIEKDGFVRIIDYKYSNRSAKVLAQHYKPQLDLYRLATSKILKIEKEKIRCTIVNICLGFQVDVE